MQNLAVILLSLAVSNQPTVREADFDPSRGRRITVAVVQDGPSPGDDVVPLVERELVSIAGENRFTFKTDPAFDAGWDPARAVTVLESAMKDRSVKYILAHGLLVSQAAAGMELRKPVICAFPQRIDLFGIHDAEKDRSLKEKLSFILIPLTVEGDLVTFESFIRRKAVVLIEETYATHVDRVPEEVEAIARKLGIEAEVVPVSGDVDATLARVAGDTRVAILGPTPRLTPVERTRLIEKLTALELATVSLIGIPDVEIGALAARIPDISVPRARRIALNLNELARRTDQSELPVILPTDPRLIVNGKTAAAIGFAPHLEVMVAARILHPEALELDAEVLDLPGAMKEAEASNIDLQISTQDMETSFRERQVARSALLPQLFAVPSYGALSAGGLEGLIPDRRATIGIALSQMIYDDRRVADFKSSNRLYEGSQEAREVERLDVLRRAGRAYLSLVVARVLYRIQVENLKLTEENLDLARLRLNVGYSGRDEVYRWEAEVAKRRSELLDSEAEIETRRIALNQVLGVDQARRWIPTESMVDPSVFPFVDERLNPLLRDASGLREWCGLMVDFALSNAPELGFVDKSIEAREIQLGQRKRRWYLPQFTFDFLYDYDFYQSPDIPSLDKDAWRLELVGVYPIFEGGLRAEDIRLVASELETLRQERERAMQLVERRTRSSMRRMEASFPSIRFAGTQAEKAGLNLEVVQDKYAQGLVNVTDLLEATTESFTAQQGAAAANYDFQLDLIFFQRAISWFEDEKTAEEKDVFVDWVEAQMPVREE